MEVLRRVRARRVGVIRRLAAGCLLAALVGGTTPLGAQRPAAGTLRWPVKSREHVDLWLHGFAMVSADSSLVPLYRRGYREALLVARNAASAFTDLDANAESLRTTLASRPNLLAAQFLALQFGTWAELEGAVDLFLKTDGNPRAATTETATRAVGLFAQVFRTREERDFARRFVNALRSEREKFHHQWWLAEMRRRDPALAAVDSLWQTRIRPRLQPFLNHIQQADGELILSTVLEGEGRTIADDTRRTSIACAFPESRDRAMDAISCALHELVGSLTAAAVEDNVTPAEKRSGVADRYQSAALVRGGAVLAARLGADVAAAYVQFYLRAAGRDAETDPAVAFAIAFPLPEAMLSSIERQVAVAFSGI